MEITYIKRKVNSFIHILPSIVIWKAKYFTRVEFGFLKYRIMINIKKAGNE